jgi:hypothetical protein
VGFASSFIPLAGAAAGLSPCVWLRATPEHNAISAAAITIRFMIQLLFNKMPY